MRLAKKTHSDPMKLQMPTLRLSRPRKLSSTACGSASPQCGYSNANAINTGYKEGAGMWILLKSTIGGAAAAGLACSKPVASTLPYFVTQKGSRAVTVGIVAKL